jgi:hypothetical protein
MLHTPKNTSEIGSNSSNYKDYYLLQCDTMQSGRSLPTLWKNLLPPFSGPRVEEAGSPQMVMICQAKPRHIPQDTNMQM